MQKVITHAAEMPSQQVLVQKHLDWNRVGKRLEEFSHIQSHFPEKVLRKGINKPPYYCHYMAWRLGTWPDNNDDLFELFDRLLGIASGLENWKKEFSNFKSSCDFAEFWSLLWQLQVAHFFMQSGDASWNPKGPDLAVRTGHGTFYVECYAYRKSFGVENFIEELMRKVDKNIRVEHQSNLPFALPSDNTRNQFLDELFHPYLNPEYLDNKRKEAQQSWPANLHVPVNAKNFRVYLEGPTQAYAPGLNASGGPSNYRALAIKEGIESKKNSNDLVNHRPNILAINYLLSPDYQMSCNALAEMGEKLPSIDFGKSLDAVLLASCGIDCKLSSNNSLPILTRWSKDVARHKFNIKGVQFVEIQC
ncbi:MAG: hypothetical protein Q9M30_00555 [Mariprofundaceae bacterium]|nr:hypothetical protein [Mariprofundaceae bacterium]